MRTAWLEQALLQELGRHYLQQRPPWRPQPLRCQQGTPRAVSSRRRDSSITCTLKLAVLPASCPSTICVARGMSLPAECSPQYPRSTIYARIFSFCRGKRCLQHNTLPQPSSPVHRKLVVWRPQNHGLPQSSRCTLSSCAPWSRCGPSSVPVKPQAVRGCRAVPYNTRTQFAGLRSRRVHRASAMHLELPYSSSNGFVLREEHLQVLD
mmetsp:Transcript_6757/g.11713  ORF Transcript_6757/g.11713 Transcript_6757/m.11713 type:complete len:208 (-) Transcript_6757:77-700(-)